MRLLPRKRRRLSPPPRPPRDEEAYLRLEEARLHCLRLRDHASSEPARERLAAAYRELGMAGYMASNEIPSRRRLAILAEAHERCERPARDGLRTLHTLAQQAAVAVERALVAPGITDHLQLAVEHVARAEVALGAILVDAPTAAAGAHH